MAYSDLGNPKCSMTAWKRWTLSLYRGMDNMDVTVNEIPIAVPTGVFTWGQFLDWLETNYLDNGQCITKVLLDGREEINYRNASLCTQTLKTVNTVDVESREFDNVIRESSAELDEELDAALALAANTARTFNARDELQGYPQLNQLLNGTRVLFSIMCEDLGWIDLA